MATRQLTKRTLLRLIKEEINKVLFEQTMNWGPGEIEREIRKVQAQINNWKKDLRTIRRLYIGGSGPRDRAPEGVARGLLNSYPGGTSTLGQYSDYADKMVKKQLDQMKDLQMALKKNPKQQSKSGPFGLGPGMTQSPQNFPGSLCPGGATPIGTNPDGSPMCPGQSTPAPAAPGSTPAAPATKKKRRGRGRGTYFLRKYRSAGIDKAFAKEFGGTDRAAFDKFYDKVNMPRRSRDYKFGPSHYRKFTGLVGKDRSQMQGTVAQKSAVKMGTAASDEAALAGVTRKFSSKYKAATGDEQERIFRNAVRDFERRTDKPVPQDLQSMIRSVLAG